LAELFGFRQRLVDVEAPDLQDLRPEGPAYSDPLPAEDRRHDDEHPVALDGGTIESALPVLPLVASTMVSPCFSSPSSSALSTMYLAIRALMEPEGFRYSSFA
jgi:hypothetical protein